MKCTPTQRGFLRAEFRDRYNSKCSIQESSLATEHCLWLGVDIDFNGKDATRMHLTQDMVAELLPLLTAFVETGELPRNVDDHESQTKAATH